MGEFRHTIRVRYNECDPQGHVFNANYLAYFDLAMTELWRELGGYVAMIEDGSDMVVHEARIRYIAALGFDDEADLVVRSVALGNTSMTTQLAIERAARSSPRASCATSSSTSSVAAPSRSPSEPARGSPGTRTEARAQPRRVRRASS